MQEPVPGVPLPLCGLCVPISVPSLLNLFLKVVAHTNSAVRFHEQMRIIAGKYRSRILKSLKGNALRPTSDRLRETLFNVLAPNVSGSPFLHVFAGTGAVGIAAISRGATAVIFIQNHAPSTAFIRRNLASLDIQ